MCVEEAHYRLRVSVDSSQIFVSYDEGGLADEYPITELSGQIIDLRGLMGDLSGGSWDISSDVETGDFVLLDFDSDGSRFVTTVTTDDASLLDEGFIYGSVIPAIETYILEDGWEDLILSNYDYYCLTGCWPGDVVYGDRWINYDERYDWSSSPDHVRVGSFEVSGVEKVKL